MKWNMKESQSMTFSEIKKGGFPVIFNQPQASQFYSTIVKFFRETFQICEIIL